MIPEDQRQFGQAFFVGNSECVAEYDESSGVMKIVGNFDECGFTAKHENGFIIYSNQIIGKLSSGLSSGHFYFIIYFI